MTAKKIVYLNGSYIDESEAKLSIHDRGFIYGDAAYDIGRTFNHQPFKWKEHISRLYRSLQYIQIDIGLTQDEMYDITMEVFRRNLKNLEPKDDCLVIHRISRGAEVFPGGGVTLKETMQPTVLVECRPIRFESFAGKYVEGVHVIVASTRRTPPQCIDPKGKLQNKLNHILAELEVKRLDSSAFALMLDTRGFLAECTAQNIFLVKEGKLLTPKGDYVLEGITRNTIMELAPKIGISCFETDLTTYDLYNSDEVFISTTSLSIMPVSKLNGKPLDNPVPGPVTKRLLSAWSKMVGIDIVEQALSHRFSLHQ